MGGTLKDSVMAQERAINERVEAQSADRTLPRFGDALTQRIPGSRYAAAYHQWRDPAFLSVLNFHMSAEMLLKAFLQIVNSSSISILTVAPGLATGTDDTELSRHQSFQAAM